MPLSELAEIFTAVRTSFIREGLDATIRNYQRLEQVHNRRQNSFLLDPTVRTERMAMTNMCITNIADINWTGPGLVKQFLGVKDRWNRLELTRQPMG